MDWVRLARDKRGSYCLQQDVLHYRLEAGVLATALSAHTYDLAKHVYGNYLLSTLLAFPTAQASVIGGLVGNICELMSHPHGSRVCESMCQFAPADVSLQLLEEVRGEVLRIACTPCGSWSLSIAYECTRCPIIFHETRQHIEKLACDSNGSRTVQRVMTVATADGNVDAHVATLAHMRIERILQFASDKYGNYVMQIALRNACGEARLLLQSALTPYIPKLATDKFGSNLAETLVDQFTRDELITLLSVWDRDTHINYYSKYVLRRVRARLPARVR